jgi:hypothetical protein
VEARVRLLVTFDAAALPREIAGLEAAEAGRLRTRLAGALNEVGAEIHKALLPPLRAQTGLKGATVARAVHDLGAAGDRLAYSLTTRGGDISLKYFSPREAQGGVIARPRGVRTYVQGAFIKSGRSPNRAYAERLHGHVFRNVAGGTWRGRIRKVKSGVFIPRELVQGAARATFERMVARELPPAVGRVLTLVTG